MSFIEMLAALTRIIERLIRVKKQTEKQGDRDALEDNPDMWFSTYFKGENAPKTGKGCPDDVTCKNTHHRNGNDSGNT